MPSAQQKSSLTEYRRRLKRRGLVRLEVKVRKDDVALIRSVVKALSDPTREVKARALLRERFLTAKAKGLKALLAGAPLEGFDLKRARDLGRNVVRCAPGVAACARRVVRIEVGSLVLVSSYRRPTVHLM
jgi:hypothetical protein